MYPCEGSAQKHAYSPTELPKYIYQKIWTENYTENQYKIKQDAMKYACTEALKCKNQIVNKEQTLQC